MSKGRAPLERIAVHGGGQVALLAAVALKRALPRTAITLVRTPIRDDALADQAHTTLPSLARLHERIGIDEGGMLARADASHRLATRYSAWRLDGAEWLLGYGAAADALVSHSFAARWTGSAAAGTLTAPELSGVAAALAQVGRFAAPSDDAASPLADLDYALRFNPAAYRRRLASLAAHLGVAIADGESDVDLLLDCTGPHAALMPGAPRLDWSDQSPIRRIAVEHAPPELSSVDEVVGVTGGYGIRSPGRDATRILHCRAEGEGIALDPGRLVEPWTGKIVAIGDAAASFEPLGWCNLHLAVCQIELLLELLPGRDIDPLERAEYNRRANLLADRVRDFVALHHAARSPSLSRPEGLALTLAEYARRGRLPHFEEESIPRDLWMQLLAGLGVEAGAAPRLAAMSPETMADARETHQRRIAAAVAAAEPYPAWLAKRLGSSR